MAEQRILNILYSNNVRYSYYQLGNELNQLQPTQQLSNSVCNEIITNMKIINLETHTYYIENITKIK